MPVLEVELERLCNEAREHRGRRWLAPGHQRAESSGAGDVARGEGFAIGSLHAIGKDYRLSVRHAAIGKTNPSGVT